MSVLPSHLLVVGFPDGCSEAHGIPPWRPTWMQSYQPLAMHLATGYLRRTGALAWALVQQGKSLLGRVRASGRERLAGFQMLADPQVM